MAVYTANNPSKTLTIHKENCRVIPWDKLKSCGCGETGAGGNQEWYCEEHITLEMVDEFQNHRHWATVLCDLCFREE